MSKIIEALNVMISNKSKISDIKLQSVFHRFYFKYLGKQVWSIEWLNFDHPDTLTARFYPAANTVEDAMIPGGVTNVEYRSSEWTSREAIETFKDLYKTVEESHFGVTKVLDEIIQDYESAKVARR